jgi:SAM-dependent methyltransferase
MSAASSAYVLGHSDHERRRLALQAKILNPITEGFMIRAGIKAGMNVLDAGCGVGDVSLMVAKLVGPDGHVTGVDVDGRALEIARQRAAEGGFANASFEQSSITEYVPPVPADAAVGRLILIHMTDPAAALHRAIAQARPGGIVAFQEYDVTAFPVLLPPKPLFEYAAGLVIRLLTRSGHPDIGKRLFQLFHDAGLERVECRAEYALDGGPDCPYYEWVAETVRSMLPMLEAAGIAASAEVDIETLADRLKEEAVRIGGFHATPVIVGASGQVPA